MTWIFFDSYWQQVNGHLTEGLAGDIAWVIQGYEADPTPAGLKRLEDRAEQSLDLSIILQPNGKLPVKRHFALFGIDRALEQALSDRIDAPYWFDTTRYPGLRRHPGQGDGRGAAHHRPARPRLRHPGLQLHLLADAGDACC